MLSNISRTATWTEWESVEQFKTMLCKKLLHVRMSNEELNILQDGCDFLENMIESAKEDKIYTEE